MRRPILGLILAVIAAASTGCCRGERPLCKLFGGCGQCQQEQQSCGGEGCQAGCGDCAGTDPGQYGGPPTAAVAYPYYTTRGPRDFLAKNPRGIGP